VVSAARLIASAGVPPPPALATVVVAVALTALVWVLLMFALLTSEPEAPVPTVALMTIVPEAPPEICPAVASVDDLTPVNVSCWPACVGVTAEPFSVALTKVTPAGSVSMTWAPVAVLCPVLANDSVYWIAVDTPPGTLALSTVLASVRFAGGVTQKSARELANVVAIGGEVSLMLFGTVPSYWNRMLVDCELFDVASYVQSNRWLLASVPVSGTVNVNSPVWLPVNDCVDWPSCSLAPVVEL
jgi:hypothetical protein